ncbi:hypothetical protein F8388_011971 [Cannabis sativa]|uniref:Xylanase inhibitor C-terminal domain-containing protein n=1 Tax=Cannabis sativa TaxID=3483 RepID=A0A7J6GG05_CANSA|nr:hypothetical protein G4B88_024977 [Cannabis sativa]KAF4381049.1 hypothetical protein F8388_011971 [Cannabis sativa]
MAISFYFLLFTYLFFSNIITPSIAKPPVFKPQAVLIPLTKDASTKQYIAKINQRTPLVPLKLTIDLGGDILMISCQKGYVSSTYKPSRCGSAPCNRAGQISTSCNDCVEGPKPGCNNNTCSVSPYNPFTLRSTGGELAQDIIAIHSTNGHNVGTKALKLNTTLFSISAKDGTGGTKISTSQPYTSLETSIYKAIVGEFSKALAEVPRVKAVAPFSLCFNSTSIGITRTRPAVPQIDLVLQNNNVRTIFGANSMVKVRNGVLCLGFVDGGKLYFQDFDIPYSPTAIIIGGHQIEDNLLEFDLVASRLGFTSSLLFSQTSCSSKFNFTSNNAYVE